MYPYKTMPLRHTLSVLLIILLSACGSDDNTPATGNPAVDDNHDDTVTNPQPTPDVTWEKVSTISRDRINGTFPFFAVEELNAKYDVDVYEIRYPTRHPNGDTITASGLIAIPVKPTGTPSPLLSYHHGTIYLESQAPSANPEYVGVNIMASGLGYISLSADYIGYGHSSQYDHPYLHAESMATTIVDFIKAGHLFISQEDIASNDQLFLAGYSEGGYATLAAHRWIEQHRDDELTVTASAPGAGPYDMTETALSFAASDTLAQPANNLFVLKTYHDLYGIGPLERIMAPPLVDTVATVFNGEFSADAIQERLGTYRPDELFQADFLASFIAGEETYIMEVMSENDIYDWAPSAPTRLFHGENDLLVPPFNATRTAEIMTLNGAPLVEAVACDVTPPADHASCFWPYVLDTARFFSEYAADL